MGYANRVCSASEHELHKQLTSLSHARCGFLEKRGHWVTDHLMANFVLRPSKGIHVGKPCKINHPGCLSHEPYVHMHTSVGIISDGKNMQAMNS